MAARTTRPKVQQGESRPLYVRKAQSVLHDANVNGPYTFSVFPDTGSAYSLDKATSRCFSTLELRLGLKLGS